MSIFQWLQTYYFWLPFTTIVMAFSLLAIFEHINREPDCPTCESNRKYMRNSVEYQISANFKTIEPCADEWHDRRVELR